MRPLRVMVGVLALAAALGACGTAPPEAPPATAAVSATPATPPSSTPPPTTRPAGPCTLAITTEGTQVSGGGGASISTGGGGAPRMLTCSKGPPIGFEDEPNAMVFTADGRTTRLRKGEQARVGAYEVTVVELSRTAVTVEIARVG